MMMTVAVTVMMPDLSTLALVMAMLGLLGIPGGTFAVHRVGSESDLGRLGKLNRYRLKEIKNIVFRFWEFSNSITNYLYNKR